MLSNSFNCWPYVSFRCSINCCFYYCKNFWRWIIVSNLCIVRPTSIRLDFLVSHRWMQAAFDLSQKHSEFPQKSTSSWKQFWMVKPSFHFLTVIELLATVNRKVNVEGHLRQRRWDCDFDRHFSAGRLFDSIVSINVRRQHSFCTAGWSLTFLSARKTSVQCHKRPKAQLICWHVKV